MDEKIHTMISLSRDKEVVWQHYFEYNKKADNGWEELNVRNWLLSICSKLTQMQAEFMSCQ